ncbi:hypothetical protein A3B32_03585 [Candidatus Uhrbacteria bacterium RIFCSPLOWO2_01_FULL_53_9]|uniref:Uncharacterized protein n=2 Tax=Candidatus Uhriibacteriota TaxID=1752732 RepID=A0A1F7UY41_9BACT|nr:MAG: hypothetical protein A3C17_03385 [Candidatus Uhrbacteria bacterium RIFCSPHIGHO2_02_FULL_53_13]OGL83179.1 MAG: hypothetical protein A3B32_03585 [Candidatus Uhrbacteria bacterium RIFCSPLOWO2_01_FULL_53_9]
MNPKIFPVDIWSAKQLGIEEWQENFFWPVSDEEYVQLCQDVLSVWRQRIDAEPQHVGDAVLVKSNIVTDCQHELHALWVLQRLAESGHRPLYTERSLWYRRLSEHSTEEAVDVPVNRMVNECTLPRSLFFLRAIKRAIRAWRFNLSAGKMYSASTVYVFGVPSGMVAEYAKSLPEWVHLSYQEDWLAHDSATSAFDEKTARDAASAFVSEMVERARQRGIVVSDAHQRRFISRVAGELLDASETLERMSSRVAQKGRVHVLTPTLNDPFARSLAIQVRAHGGSVTGFAHGGSIGMFDTPFLSMSEFALADEFMTYTEASVSLFQELHDRYASPRNHRTQIRSAHSNLFRRAWDDGQRQVTPTSIKRVMLLGFPYNPWRKPQSPGGLALLHVDMERRLVNALSQQGYEVLYKVHPDRREEAAGIFDDKAHVVLGEFRDCVDQADAIVIGSLRTTALPYALCTQKPVIALSIHGDTLMHAEAKAVLQQRCVLLETDFDDRNRIIPPIEALVKALQKPFVAPQADFIEQYLIP